MTRAASKATNANGKFLLSGKHRSALAYGVENKIIINKACVDMRVGLLRALSSNSGNQNNENKTKTETGQEGEEDRKELVLTPGEKVVVGTRLTMMLGIAALASVCGYYIIKELMPTKMSPNSAFDKAFELIKKNNEINRLLGGSLKGYGRDHGGHREGRRNFIEHSEYTSEEDGSSRTRVRFNLEGQHGTAFVFAEVSSKMKSGEFVYILVQDKRNGHVVTVVDNRSAITAGMLTEGNQAGMQAITNLLSGGKSEK